MAREKSSRKAGSGGSGDPGATRPTLLDRPRPRRIGEPEVTEGRPSAGSQPAPGGTPSDELAQRVGELEAGFASRVDKLDHILSDASHLLGEVLPERLAELDELLDRLQHVEPQMRSSLRALKEEALAARGRFRGTSQRLERAAVQIEAAGEVLASHRQGLSGLLRAERHALVERLLEGVVERLVAGLPRRARRRLAAEVESLRYEPGMGDARPLELGPGGADVREHPAAVGEIELTPSPESASPADDAPGEIDRVADAERAAAERERLIVEAMEVRGIGPTRAELLADEFEDLESVAVADVEEIRAAVRLGVPAAQALVARARGALVDGG